MQPDVLSLGSSLLQLLANVEKTLVQASLSAWNPRAPVVLSPSSAVQPILKRWRGLKVAKILQNFLMKQPMHCENNYQNMRLQRNSLGKRSLCTDHKRVLHLARRIGPQNQLQGNVHNSLFTCNLYITSRSFCMVQKRQAHKQVQQAFHKSQKV